jgi:hypothetical protein
MKATFAAVLAVSALASFAALGPARANSDDAKWIRRCVSDNADQHQSAGTIATYCSCMDNKMPESETRSITAWEKTHPAAQEACSKEAHWKD